MTTIYLEDLSPARAVRRVVVRSAQGLVRLIRLRPIFSSPSGEIDPGLGPPEERRDRRTRLLKSVDTVRCACAPLHMGAAEQDAPRLERTRRTFGGWCLVG